jgi:hypothetical protein
VPIGLAKTERRRQLRPVRDAGAENDRVDHELELVYQPRADELTCEVGSADVEVAIQVASHVGQDLADVAAHESSAVVHGLEAGREDHPRQRVPEAREVALHVGDRRIVPRGRPVRVHQLVDSASVQCPAGRPELIVPPGVDLLVDDRPIEATV